METTVGRHLQNLGFSHARLGAFVTPEGDFDAGACLRSLFAAEVPQISQERLDLIFENLMATLQRRKKQKHRAFVICAFVAPLLIVMLAHRLR